jgi:hypothetical protein
MELCKKCNKPKTVEVGYDSVCACDGNSKVSNTAVEVRIMDLEEVKARFEKMEKFCKLVKLQSSTLNILMLDRITMLNMAVKQEMDIVQRGFLQKELERALHLNNAMGELYWEIYPEEKPQSILEH